MVTCPICGQLLYHERHLHAEDPDTVYGEVRLPPLVTVETPIVRSVSLGRPPAPEEIVDAP